MHKSATKCNETIGKWCKNKHGASKIIDTFETYQGSEAGFIWWDYKLQKGPPKGIKLSPSPQLLQKRTSIKIGKTPSGPPLPSSSLPL
jgi:hypothetical protein